jgi:ABC-2 type transport system permease protein
MIRLVRSEIRKLTTTRLWWGLLIGLLGATLIGVVAQASLAGRTISGVASPGLDDPAVIRAVYGAGVQTAYLFTMALGVIGMAGEYRHQTITATLLAAPRRAPVVPAKAIALLAIGLAYGLANALLSVVVGAPILVARGADPRLFSDGVPRALLTSVLAIGLWTLIGLGIGTLVRNQIVALLVAIGAAFLAEPLLSLGLNAIGAGEVARYLPSQATAAILTPPANAAGISVAHLPWWGGALVLLGYAAGSGALGAAVTLRRDVT